VRKRGERGEVTVADAEGAGYLVQSSIAWLLST
jgi:hypothetical protein